MTSRHDFYDKWVLDEGVYYLAGAEHYFCSAVINYALSGSVAQPLSHGAQIKGWDDTVLFRELIESDLAAMVPRSSCSPDPVRGRHPSLNPKRNMVRPYVAGDDG